jgi:hypothetical protein
MRRRLTLAGLRNTPWTRRETLGELKVQRLLASKAWMDPLVQLAVLQLDNLEMFHNILLKWSYVLHVRGSSMAGGCREGDGPLE